MATFVHKSQRCLWITASILGAMSDSQHTSHISPTQQYFKARQSDLPASIPLQINLLLMPQLTHILLILMLLLTTYVITKMLQNIQTPNSLLWFNIFCGDICWCSSGFIFQYDLFRPRQLAKIQTCRSFNESSPILSDCHEKNESTGKCIETRLTKRTETSQQYYNLAASSSISIHPYFGCLLQAHPHLCLPVVSCRVLPSLKFLPYFFLYSYQLCSLPLTFPLSFFRFALEKKVRQTGPA